jgi:cytochrome c553
MKIPFTPYLLTTIVGLFLMSAAPHIQSPDPAVPFTDQNLVFPDDVMAIIENKCIGCHNPDAKNEKAREKLQWAQLAKMETEDLISKLDALFEVLEEGEMPPAKMLERNPEKKLTDQETLILQNWADENIERLIGE